MSSRSLFFEALILAIIIPIRLTAGLPEPLRLNQLQMKGTHNSYHLASPWIPWRIFGHSHEPIKVQLEKQGVRHLELDIHSCSGDDFCIYHFGILDSKSSCETLTECLAEVRDWSKENPNHHPIFILVEPKDGARTTRQDKYFGRLEKNILSVFSREELITPDHVLGRHSNLREAVTTAGWPTIESMRGRVLFVLLDDDKHRDNMDLEIPSVRDRILFPLSSKERSDAAVIRLDDPIVSKTKIAEFVHMGFIVRTRADTDLRELRNTDFARFDAALQSGAQLISTDVPQKLDGYNYFVDIPGGTPSRCNPVSAPIGCHSFMIEYLY